MIGYKVFSHKNLCWRYVHGALVPLSLPHVEKRIDVKEAKQILKKSKSLFVRWEPDFDIIEETDWWHVIKDNPEVLGDLKKKVRNMVRRGCKSYCVERCDRSFVVQRCYSVYKKAFSRYDTFEARISENDFRKAIEELPVNTEFWAVFERESRELVAFSENYVSDGACFYVSVWLDPDHIRKFSGYALFHEMNKHYLNDIGLKYVSDGARSINHDTSVHDFLLSKFGFRRAYTNLSIVYSRKVKVIVSILYPLRAVIARLPGKTFAKVGVLLRQEEIIRSMNSGVGNE